MASLNRPSASTALTGSRGDSSRRMMLAPASGSVGDTIAPSANAPAQERPPITACATTATATIVASTRPTAVSPTVRTLRRMYPRSVKNAAPYTSGGRNTTSTTLGLSLKAGNPGTKPNAAPPSTSTIGYGIRIWRASAPRPATATSSPAIRSSA